MNKEEALLKLRTILPALSQKYPIEKLGIFGSVARGEQTPESDLDIVAHFNGPIGWEFIDLANELEKEMNCKVDLVSQKGIKPWYWNHIKSDIIYA
jgi:predicted nucleotidyltransferase